MANFFVILSCFLVQAKMFRNAYISFELPQENWDCQLDQTEWVCRSQKQPENREAIIILTAKEVGPMDTFEAYKQHLNTSQPTAYKVPGGENLSKVIYPPKEVKINDHLWVDGLHLNSEVPNYYTRYLATIKEGIAVLVTLSAHKDHYSRYSKDFFKTVQSLRVIATKALLSDPKLGPIRPSQQGITDSLATAIPQDMVLMAEENMQQSSGIAQSGKTKTLFLVLAIALMLLGLILFFKKRRS